MEKLKEAVDLYIETAVEIGSWHEISQQLERFGQPYLTQFSHEIPEEAATETNISPC